MRQDGGELSPSSVLRQKFRNIEDMFDDVKNNSDSSSSDQETNPDGEVKKEEVDQDEGDSGDELTAD